MGFLKAVSVNKNGPESKHTQGSTPVSLDLPDELLARLRHAAVSLRTQGKPPFTQREIVARAVDLWLRRRNF